MIFCVEDDDSIRELELYALKSSGMSGEGFSDGESFWQAMHEKKPCLILLDIMLPGEDGISILKRLRNNPSTESIPIIMTTAKGTEYDKVQALDLGADDYLAKPFGMMEMISRIRAVLRRCGIYSQKNNMVISHLGIRLDKANYLVCVDDAAVAVTKLEFELLQLFMSNPKRVFTRDMLLDKIWGKDYAGETRTVDMHISSLRSKLGQYGSMIRTVRGVGYRLESDSIGE